MASHSYSLIKRDNYTSVMQLKFLVVAILIVQSGGNIYTFTKVQEYNYEFIDWFLSSVMIYIFVHLTVHNKIQHRANLLNLAHAGLIQFYTNFSDYFVASMARAGSRKLRCYHCCSGTATRLCHRTIKVILRWT